MSYESISDNERTLLANLMPQDLFGVYVGKAGACCCGCSGTHTYLLANRVAAGLNRGYEVDNDEVDDARVKRVLRKLQRVDPSLINAGDNHFALTEGGRLSIVYLVESVEYKRCEACHALAISTHMRAVDAQLCKPCWERVLQGDHGAGRHEQILPACPTCMSADGV